MGLKMPVEMNTGAVAEYWKITYIDWNAPDNINIRYSGFINREASSANKEPLVTFTKSGHNAEAFSRAQAYQFIKSNAGFLNSEDVFEEGQN